jgi:hypothetical protein
MRITLRKLKASDCALGNAAGAYKLILRPANQGSPRPDLSGRNGIFNVICTCVHRSMMAFLMPFHKEQRPNGVLPTPRPA